MKKLIPVTGNCDSSPRDVRTDLRSESPVFPIRVAEIFDSKLGWTRDAQPDATTVLPLRLAYRSLRRTRTRS